jgi:hypothetical protein
LRYRNLHEHEEVTPMQEVRDDLVHCRPFADEQVCWEFGDRPGWSRIDHDGGCAWQWYGPLDEFGKTHLLKHFGLEDTGELSLEGLQGMPPSELRALAERSKLRVVTAA